MRRRSYTPRKKYFCANPMEVKYWCKKCDEKEIVRGGINKKDKKCPVCGSIRKVILE